MAHTAGGLRAAWISRCTMYRGRCADMARHGMARDVVSPYPPRACVKEALHDRAQWGVPQTIRMRLGQKSSTVPRTPHAS
jgi:hypothetical protein